MSVLLWLVLMGPVFAAEETVDHVALAALMAKDGHWDRADATLAEVDTSQDGVDIERFHAVRGLVRLHAGEHEGAAADFYVAEALPSTWLPMAHALVGLGLFQEAAAFGRRHLERSPSPEAVMALARALRGAGATREAALLLEEGRLRWPDELDLTVRLAGAWLELGKPLAAGELLQQAAARDPDQAALAAECFLRADRAERALYMNAAVPDPTVKATQRLAILVQLERWEEAAALEPRLRRLGVVEDEIAYALGYAFFQIGEHDHAERALAEIEDAALFRDANQLRRRMGSP